MTPEEYNELLKIYANCEGASRKCETCPLWKHNVDLCEELTELYNIISNR